MNMISCDNHAIRKALQLSLNEMAVLVDIFKLSGNPRFGYKCVKSKNKMAEWLDLSEDTIFRAISTLERKEYVKRISGGIRPTQFIHDIELCQEELAIYIKSDDTELFTAKMSELSKGKLPQNQRVTTAKSESGLPQNQILNSNYKELTKEEPPLFGNEHPKDQKEIHPAQGGGPEVSEEGMNFANWFAKEYPTNKPPTTRQKMNWAVIYDKLLRLDGYTKQDVIKAVKWAKNDNFWTTNFYTPVKLREKKDEVSYMERFLNGANAHKPKEEPIKHKTSGAYNPVTGQYE